MGRRFASAKRPATDAAQAPAFERLSEGECVEHPHMQSHNAEIPRTRRELPF
jgi:hypothetical protein